MAGKTEKRLASRKDIEKNSSDYEQKPLSKETPIQIIRATTTTIMSIINILPTIIDPPEVMTHPLRLQGSGFARVVPKIMLIVKRAIRENVVPSSLPMLPNHVQIIILNLAIIIPIITEA